MAKSELKTKETGASVHDFLDSLEDEQQRVDSYRVIELFRRVTGEEPRMWGPAIIGFGNCVLKYDSGREFDWMLTGFSPRKAVLTLYVVDNAGGDDELLSKLGKYKTGKVCLYIKRLTDVDEAVLEKLIERAFKRAKENAGAC